MYSGLDGTQCTVGFSTYVQLSNCLGALVYSGLCSTQCTQYCGLLYLCTNPQLCRCSSVQWTIGYTVYSGLLTYVQPCNCVGVLVYSELYGIQCTVGYSTYAPPRNCVGARVYSKLYGTQSTVGYSTYVQPRNCVGALGNCGL